MKKISRIIILLVVSLFLATPVSFASNIYLTNHALVNQTLQTRNGGITGDYFITIFQPPGQCRFQSIDQFVALQGSYKIEINIKDDGGNLIDSIPPFYINAEFNGYTHGNRTTWKTTFPYAGMYKYIIYANGEVIAEFKFPVYS